MHKRFLPALSIAAAITVIGANRSFAGPLTSSKTAIDAQIQAIEGTSGAGLATVSGPLLAVIALIIIIFVLVTLAMAALEGGGNLPLAERVKNILAPAALITVGLAVAGGLITWIAQI